MQTLSDLPSTRDAMTSLKQAHPTLAALLVDLPAEETPDYDAISTNGEKILVNSEFLEARNADEQVYMLAFMAFMVEGDFLSKLADRDQMGWGLACNIFVHQHLKDIGITGLPEDVRPLIAEGAEGLTPDEIYDRLVAGTMIVQGKTLKEMQAHRAMLMEIAETGTLPILGEGKKA